MGQLENGEGGRNAAEQWCVITTELRGMLALREEEEGKKEVQVLQLLPNLNINLNPNLYLNADLNPNLNLAC